MPLTLYYTPASGPCRAVMLTAKALNLELELKLVNLQQGEHLKSEYLKLNPQHTVPTLVDDGFSVWESRAIITYLANKYGKGSSLYPEDPKVRALVDQRLYFDIGTLTARLSDYFFPQAFFGKPADSEKKAKVEDALKILDQFLDGQTYIAGEDLTLADLSLVVTVSNFEITDVDFRKYTNIKRWYEKVQQTVPGYKEANQDGLEVLREFIEMMMKKKDIS